MPNSVSNVIDRIAQRRAELARQLEQGKAAYARAEAQLCEMDRELCGMLGGLAELARLQAALENDAFMSIVTSDDARGG
jgi:hypothetical protein